MVESIRFFMSLPEKEMEMIDNIVAQINAKKSRPSSYTNRQAVTRALLKVVLGLELTYKSTWTRYVTASLKP